MGTRLSSGCVFIFYFVFSFSFCLLQMFVICGNYLIEKKYCVFVTLQQSDSSVDGKNGELLNRNVQTTS